MSGFCLHAVQYSKSGIQIAHKPGIYIIQYCTIVYAPNVTGSVFIIRRFRLFLGQCAFGNFQGTDNDLSVNHLKKHFFSLYKIRNTKNVYGFYFKNVFCISLFFANVQENLYGNFFIQ